MGSICQKLFPKKKKQEASLLDVSKDESSGDDPYDINTEIKRNVVVIYIYPACHKECQCQQVLDLFSSINSKPLVNNIGADSNPKKLLKALKNLTGQKKPPFVFLTGKYLGGLSETEQGVKNHSVQREINKWLDSRVRFGSN